MALNKKQQKEKREAEAAGKVYTRPERKRRTARRRAKLAKAGK